MRSLDRPIYLDNRPHPPAYAPHSWSGFSTGGSGKGQTLKVTTTHLKDGFLKRGGPQTSDMLTMTEYITAARRHHDDRAGGGRPDLSGRAVRPLHHYTYDPKRRSGNENCSGSRSAKTAAPIDITSSTFLPGQNSGIGEFLKTENWIPLEAARGGGRRSYPEYRAVLAGTRPPSQRHGSRVALRQRRREAHCDQSPRDGPGARAAGAGATSSCWCRRHEHHGVGRHGRIAVVNSGSRRWRTKCWRR
jgi:hypothetical protein